MSRPVTKPRFWFGCEAYHDGRSVDARALQAADIVDAMSRYRYQLKKAGITYSTYQIEETE